METCKYFIELDGVKQVFNSDRELSDFVRNNISKKGNRVKFSKDGSGVINSKEKTLERIKNRAPKSGTVITSFDFLREQQIIDGQLKYLSPVFISSNYKELAVNSLIEKDPKISELYKTNQAEAKKLAEEQIDKELDLDEKMKGISSFMSGLMEGMVNKKVNLNDKIDELFVLVAKYNLKNPTKEEINDYIILNYDEETKRRIKYELQEKWYKKIANSDKDFLGKVWLNKNKLIKDAETLSSKISYLSVSPDGVADIYRIKTSRKKYKDWHSSKILTTDYELGIDNQLYQDIGKTNSLYITPVYFPTKGDELLLNSFYIEEDIDRSTFTSKAGLNEGGDISEKLKKLLPSIIHEDSEESSKLDLLNKEILDVMFPKYNFRTKVMIQDVEKRYKKLIDDFKGEPNIFFYDAISGRRVQEKNTPEGQEAIKQELTEYIEKANSHANSHMLDLTKAIMTAKNEHVTNKDVEIKHGRSSAELQRTFGQYLSEEWELITNRPELLNAGMLVFRNNNTSIVEVVSMTVNQLNQVNNFSLGNTIVGQFKRNSDVQKDDKILKASNSTIEAMKALTVLNNNPDLINGYSLNHISVFNTLENKGEYMNLNSSLYNFDKLLSNVNNFRPVENNFKGANPALKVSNFLEAIYAKMLTGSLALENKVFKAMLEKSNTDGLTENRQKLDYFINLRAEFLKEFKNLENVDHSKVQNFSDPKMYVYGLISNAITYYSEIDSVFDYDVPRYGIASGDWLHWVRTTLFGSAPEYDKNGKKVVGLFQGQIMSTTDTTQSKYLSKLYDIINIAQNAIVTQYEEMSNMMIEATNEYYDEVNRSGLEKFLIGNSDRYHEPLFEQFNGQITKEFKLKNPWKDATLSTAERKYLQKFVYFQYINKKNPNLKLNTFEKFEKSVELQQMLSEGGIDSILKVPLIKRQSIIGRFKNLTTEKFRTLIGRTWDSVVNSLDTRDLTGEELDEERQRVGAYNAINEFGRIKHTYELQESEELRESMINEYKVGHFERNLDTIGLKYSFETIRQKNFERIMPQMSAAAISMQVYGWNTGKTKETEAALKGLSDALNLNVHNKTIINDPELAKAMGVVKQIQSTISVMTIALRPMLMMKELLVGQVKNASYAWSKIYGGDFEGKYITESYKIMMKSQEDYDLTKKINTLYQIANRDLNQIVARTKVDRTGLNFFSDALFWFNTAPDYVNRMSLFLSKMLKDGTYKAHSLDSTGKLVYDPSKDDRFSYYFKVREGYSFEYNKSDEKYNNQRALYTKFIQEFNADSLLTGGKQLTEKDNIPKAYTNKERESIKSFTDLSYGHYDKERNAPAKHTVLGILFGQYMTFWPSKVKYYLGKPGEPTKRGRYNHKHEIIDGEKVYYYVKWETNEAGEEYRLEVKESELTPNDPRIKAVEWEGDPVEGLMYSLSSTARAVIKGDLDNVHPEHLANAKIAIHDLLVAMLAILLGYFLMKDYNKSDKDKTKMSQYEQLITKTVKKGLAEFNPWESIFGSLQSTPAFIDRLGQSAESIKSFVSGNSDVEKMLRKNFVFFEVLPNIPNPLARY